MRKLTQFFGTVVLGLLVCGSLRAAVPVPPPKVLVLYDDSGPYGWLGNIYAKMLDNLLGHFELDYINEPVDEYKAGQMDNAVATFYFGTAYRESFNPDSVWYDPLPPAFLNDVLTTAQPVCWLKYNLWQLSGSAEYPQPFDERFGLRFVDLDTSGYSNILYKGVTFSKNQLDPELGWVTNLAPDRVDEPMTAWRTNEDGTAVSLPYALHSDNFWYLADIPFDYISEGDRYVAFADLLHDILGIDHAERHRAIIRLEDVTMEIYYPEDVRTAADYLHSQQIPFALAVIPVYTDPLGFYDFGIPEEHRISDASDPDAAAFRDSLAYAVTNGGQIIIHGYTHQYDATPNPYDGATADDFEFFRETFDPSDPNHPYKVNLFQPVPEDSKSWVTKRIKHAQQELNDACLPWVAWETPHYSASALDYQVLAKHFPLFMERSLYFADDYNSTNGHYAGQFFPYVIQKDIYGRRIVPENIGNFSPEPWADFPAHLPEDLLRAAKQNLAVRDGWANAYFHGYYDITNLQAIVSGIQALGYTYVPLAPDRPQLQLQTDGAGNLELTFSTQNGVGYDVEYRDPSTDNLWTPMAEIIGDGTPALVPVDYVGAARFYRLRVE